MTKVFLRTSVGVHLNGESIPPNKKFWKNLLEKTLLSPNDRHVMHLEQINATSFVLKNPSDLNYRVTITFGLSYVADIQSITTT